VEVIMAYRFIPMALALTMFAAPAFAQQQQPQACGQRDDMLTQLKDKYHEDPAGFGMTGNGAVVELMTSENGSWTLMLSFPNGKSCLMATGDGWELWKNMKKVAGKDA
jgi:hypothetical protein